MKMETGSEPKSYSIETSYRELPSPIFNGGVVMNEEQKQQELERRLEQATAADPQAPLVPEASALHKGWTAWGNLLESGNVVDDKLLKQLLDIPTRDHTWTCPKHQCNEDPYNKPRTLTTISRQFWVKHKGMISATLIVTLFLAVGMFKFSPSIIPPPKDIPNSSLAWNDALDERMTVIEERMTVVGYDCVSLGSSFDSVQSQLDSLDREINQSSM
jgi:hypothetical protein